MTRYRLRPFVLEHAEGGHWLGSLPDGPIIWVCGSGALVFESLEALAQATEPPGEIAADEIVDWIARVVPDLPQDAEQTIAEFLTDLETSGVLESNVISKE